MIKRFKNLTLALASLFVFATPAVVPVAAFAQSPDIEDGLCAGSNLDVNSVNGCDPAVEGEQAGETVNNLLTTVVNIFSFIVGVVAVIMIIIGGLKYITSGGDPGNVSGAKNTIIYAIIGLVIVALAQIIVRYVLAQTSSAV